MRLIDADAFIQMMEEKCDPESTLDPWVLSVCRGGVKIMPTVDAVPVVHGRWIRIPQEEMFCCDQCGRRGLSFEEFDVFGYAHDSFCAHCGARMDGEQDDNG